MVQIVQEVDSQEFWEGIIGSAWETWSWWARVDCDYDDYRRGLTVSVFNPEVDEAYWDRTNRSSFITKHLTVHDLATSYSWYQRTYGRHAYHYEDMDAAYGDVIIQHAIFGEVIYG